MDAERNKTANCGRLFPAARPARIAAGTDCSHASRGNACGETFGKELIDGVPIAVEPGVIRTVWVKQVRD